MIPYSRQNITKSDIKEVEQVLRSDFLTQGPMVPQFEQAVANYCNVTHGVAVNSATSALHVACLALGLGPGDWLWTSPNTFVASANCAFYCGAKVDFVDIDPRTYNMSVESLREKLKIAEKEGRLPKIVIPVHFAGQPCDMPAIFALSKKFGFKIIEDASHAIGASYNSIKVGSCVHSHITVFSFHPVKIITTGEGGMAMTNDNALANRMQRLRIHGITNDQELMHSRADDEIWNYQQIELGFNYRMTDIHAALGLSQIKRLNEIVQDRRKIAIKYDNALRTFPLVIPWQAPENYSSYHLYPVRINSSKCKKTQRHVFDTLKENGIAANLHYIPVHRHPYYENRGFKVDDFPKAELFYKEVISIPIYIGLNEKLLTYVVKTLRKALR